MKHANPTGVRAPSSRASSTSRATHTTGIPTTSQANHEHHADRCRWRSAGLRPRSPHVTDVSCHNEMTEVSKGCSPRSQRDPRNPHPDQLDANDVRMKDSEILTSDPTWQRRRLQHRDPRARLADRSSSALSRHGRSSSTRSSRTSSSQSTPPESRSTETSAPTAKPLRFDSSSEKRSSPPAPGVSLANRPCRWSPRRRSPDP
jgi:hypothetical protein